MHSAAGAGRLIAGRYRLLDQLGRGAMGIVWHGRDEVLDREVAVKQIVLPPLPPTVRPPPATSARSARRGPPPGSATQA